MRQTDVPLTAWGGQCFTFLNLVSLLQHSIVCFDSKRRHTIIGLFDKQCKKVLFSFAKKIEVLTKHENLQSCSFMVISKGEGGGGWREGDFGQFDAIAVSHLVSEL